MKRMNLLVARLYPKAWRERYGEEFDALLQETDGGFCDLLKGAIAMNLKNLSLRTIVVGCAVVGVMVATGIALTMPDVYISTAVLRTGQGVDPDGVGRLVAEATKQVFRQRDLGNLIESEKLYLNERQRQPLADVIEQMRSKDISVRSVGQGAIKMTYRSEDPIQAQRVNAILSERLRDTAITAKLQLIDGASAADRIAPVRWRVSVAGGVAGLVLAGVLGFVRRFMRL